MRARQRKDGGEHDVRHVEDLAHDGGEPAGVEAKRLYHVRGTSSDAGHPIEHRTVQTRAAVLFWDD
jgi:hypothetical protein